MDNIFLLLAYISANEGQVFRRADLTALFYPDYREDHAVQNMRQVIHRLRKFLREDINEAPCLLIDAVTIRVNPQGPLVTDLQQVDKILQSSQAFMAGHDHRRVEICPVCNNLLRPLIDLGAGEFLAGYPAQSESELDGWVYAVRQKYANRVLSGLLTLAQYFYERHQYDPCETVINRIVLYEPLNELAIQLRMKLLARMGFREQALLAFHEFQRTLQKSFDIGPEEETLRLAQDIRKNPKYVPWNEFSFPAQTVYDGSTLEKLPFIDRARELTQLGESLDSRGHRVIVLKGITGSGKTRLAFEAAALQKGTWKDGVYPVHGIQKKNLFSELARAMGIAAGNSYEDRQNVYQFLRSKECLILVDHIQPTVEQVEGIHRLVNLCPSIKFLITTRKHLGVRGEKVFAVDGLDYPAVIGEVRSVEVGTLEIFVQQYGALQYFRAAARQVNKNFEITVENLCAISEICEMLLGSPLGIAAAAAYARLFTCEEIRVGVYQRLHSPESGSSFISERNEVFQQKAAYLWNSLSARERKLVKKMLNHDYEMSLKGLLAETGFSYETLLELFDNALLIRLADGRINLHPLIRFFAGG